MPDIPTSTAPDNQPMAEFWNGDGGERWVDHEDSYDRQLAPFSDALLSRLSSEHSTSGIASALDVGCGTGPLTTALRSQLGADARVVGVDISTPMVDAATTRAQRLGTDGVTFEVADAQTSVPAGPHDLVVSRFGIMFFADPVSAFATIRAATGPAGRLVAVVWQARDLNRWMTEPADAIAPHVELEAPPADPRAPGPFALADPDRLADLLGRAGWSATELIPVTPTVYIGGPGSVNDAVSFAIGTGPTFLALEHASAGQRRNAVDAIRTRFVALHDGIGVAAPGAAWLIDSRR